MPQPHVVSGYGNSKVVTPLPFFETLNPMPEQQRGGGKSTRLFSIGWTVRASSWPEVSSENYTGATILRCYICIFIYVYIYIYIHM